MVGGLDHHEWMCHKALDNVLSFGESFHSRLIQDCGAILCGLKGRNSLETFHHI